MSATPGAASAAAGAGLALVLDDVALVSTILHRVPDAATLPVDDLFSWADGFSTRGGRTPLEGMRTLVIGAILLRRRGAVVRACDRAGVRVVAVAGSVREARTARDAGVASVPADPDAIVRAALASGGIEERSDRIAETAGAVVTVWGPHGAPGRSTVATLVAAELARDGARTMLVDADAHSPSLGFMLGADDEAPGLAGACRQSARGALDAAELERLSVPLACAGGVVRLLGGLNRPARWPELEEGRVAGTLRACREWGARTVVDVAASLDRDEELVTDLAGPRRNAATLSALVDADVVVALGTADPVGIARLVRGLDDLRDVVGDARVLTLVNRVRPGPLGLDPRGQIRRTLERFAAVREVWFLPADHRATDAALLRAAPIGDVAPRSSLVYAVRRFVGGALVPALGDGAPPEEADSSRRPGARSRPSGARRRWRSRTA